MKVVNSFKFKRFSVEQGSCAMKVGTDGVLLGAWCGVDDRKAGGPEAILDVGTGTGVIATQLAQRTEHFGTVIHAVEIDNEACEVAGRNFAACDWADRLVLHKISAQDFARNLAAGAPSEANAAEAPSEANAAGEFYETKKVPRKFDHIVSNPPYFIDSLASPHKARNLARHAASLSYEELMSLSDTLLTSDGRISLIVPAGVETQKMVAAAEKYGFVPSRLTTVHSTPKSGPKRTLMEFSRLETVAAGVAPAAEIAPDLGIAPARWCETGELTIQNGGPGTFSEEYRALTRDFYLYF